jgi:hypothetical protein
MIVWIAIQIAALAASAFRVRLAPEMDGATEHAALAVMLVTQVGASSLLSATLLRDFRSTSIAIATAWPVALLAAVLADVGLRQFFVAETYVTVWLAGLFFWNSALPRYKAQISAAATLFSFGGVLLWYLHAEFTTESTGIDWNRDGRWGSIMGGLSQILPSHAPANARGILAGFFAVAFLCGILRRIVCGKSDRNMADRKINAMK